MVDRKKKKEEKIKKELEIYHISGPSGAGKTTLGRRLATLPNTIVVDTDDIDDPNVMHALPDFAFKTEADFKKLDKTVAKLNKEKIDKIIKENKDKRIIFVGFFHAGMRFLEKKVKKSYLIKIDSKQLWQQYSLRTLNALTENATEIKKLLTSDLPAIKIDITLSKKYKIRNGFGCGRIEDMEHEIMHMKKNAEKKGYIYDTSDNIFAKFSKIQ